MFQKRTLRRMTPIAREVARQINELDKARNRLVKLLEDITHAEIDSLALFEKKKAQGTGEVADPDVPEWIQASALSKVTKNGGEK